MKNILWLYKRLQKTSFIEIVYKLWIHFSPFFINKYFPKTTFILPKIDLSFSEEEKANIIKIANNYLEGKWQIFEKDINAPLKDWNKCPITNKKWDILPIYKLNYRNQDKDPKYVWEINRFQHIVPLAIAYKITKNKRYLQQGIEEINDWIDKNPYGHGINWISGIELGIRIINWIIFFVLIQKDIPSNIKKSIYQHINHLHHSYSLFSSSNNHLTAETSSVMFVSSFSKELEERFFNRASSLFWKYINKLINMDGSNAEQSPYYHLHLLEHLLFAEKACKNTKRYEKANNTRELFDKGMRFINDILLTDYKLPFIGDADAGRFTGLDMHVSSEKFAQVFFVNSIMNKFLNVLPYNKDIKDGVYNYPVGGYFIYRKKDLLIIFDYGNMGYPPIYAHGHSDLFSLIMYKKGEPILIDSGIPGYFSLSDEKMKYYKGNKGHNVVQCDTKDITDLWGFFLRSKDIYPLFEWKKIKNEYYLKGTIDIDNMHWERSVMIDNQKIEIKDFVKNKCNKSYLRWHIDPAYRKIVELDDFIEYESLYAPFVGKEEKAITLEKVYKEPQFTEITKIFIDKI